MKKVLKKVMALTLAAVLTIGTAVTSTAAAPSPTTGKKPVNQIADTDSKGNNTKTPVYTVKTYDTGRARIIGAATIKKNVTVPNYVKVNGVKYRVTSIGAKSLKNWKSVKKIILSKNIKTVHNQSFKNCKSLKTIVVKNTKNIWFSQDTFNGGNNADQPLGTLYRSISLISDFLNLTKFKKSKGDQKMSKKTYAKMQKRLRKIGFKGKITRG